MENYKIRKLEDDIINLLNSSDVAIDAKRIILTNALNLVTKKSDIIIAREIQIEREEKSNELHKNELAEHAEHSNAD
jgi:hypothetical protein